MAADLKRFLLVYASQTGQAQAISEEIAEAAGQHGLQADLHCISQTEKKFWLERERLVVIVTSTTGDGEPPETSLKFWRRLKKKTLQKDHFSSLNYALLGLGDSNYTNFCRCGKSLHERLQELGAKTFYDCGWADDATGLEIEVEPWIEGLWKPLKNLLASMPKDDCSKDINVPNGTRQTAEKSPIVPKNSLAPLKPDSSSHNTQNGVSSQQNGVEDMLSQNKPPVPLKESLLYSIPPLSESSLTLPVCPPSYLKTSYDDLKKLDLTTLPVQNGAPMPTCASPIVTVPIKHAKQLTTADAVKRTLLLTLDIRNCEWTFTPGDSFSIVCPNSNDEVQTFIDRLGCTKSADAQVELSVIEGTKKKNAAVPAFIPPVSTLRHIFTNSCDFRKVPKKPFIRALVEHTANEGEKRRLQELCSKQGAANYTKHVREQGLGLLDILMAFPSCMPPVTTVLEHIERLQPRPYSIASSSLAKPDVVDIVFNIVEVPGREGRYTSKQGICTSWLAKISAHLTSTDSGCGINDLTDKLQESSIEDQVIPQVPVYLRSNQHFHAPDDLSSPIIMIGPGTGVAPFIGFLQHRQKLKDTFKNEGTVGESWLFFGCRHEARDYLFREELHEFEQSGALTKLAVCFSRDEQAEGSPKYVQDNLALHGQEVADLLTEKDATVYVCGDATNMAKDVNAACVKVLQKHKGYNEKDALGYMMKLRLNKKYFEDVWT